MGNAITTTMRGDTPASRRLSPKVRRLLRDHRLQPDDVNGTGRGGRVTPADVERHAGGHGGTHPRQRPDRGGGPALASPLARRLLRDAGLEPGDVAGTGPDNSVVRADAARAIQRARSTTPATATRDVETLEVEADLTRLLLGMGTARDPVRRRTGVELTVLAPIAHAACRALRRHPVCNGVPAPDDGDAVQHQDVDLGIVVATGAGRVAPAVACAQDLTVTALAERIARLGQGAEPDGAEDPDCTFTIGEGQDVSPAAPRQAAALTVGTTQQRSVTVADEFGHDAVATRWLATLRLAYDPRRIDEPTAAAFLDDLKREVETVDLLAGVA